MIFATARLEDNAMATVQLNTAKCMVLSQPYDNEGKGIEVSVCGQWIFDVLTTDPLEATPST